MKHVLDEGPDCPCKRAIIRGKDMPRNVPQHSAMNCAKIAEPIDLWFGMWTWGKSTTSVVSTSLRHCVLMGGHIGATWQYD